MYSSPVATLLDRARSVAPLARACAGEADRERTLPRAVVAAMAEAGLFRMAVPLALNGDEAGPSDTVRAIEAVAEGDGSAAWALMIGVETAGIAALRLPDAPARKLFVEEPLAVLAGALNPLGRAEEVEGGYLISGRWPFASGCRHASYFWGGCVITRGGKPILTAHGNPVSREMCVPAGQFTVLDTWQVAGLRGSGSHDVAVENVFVPREWSTSTYFEPALRETAHAAMPISSRLAYNKVGVATGIARAAIDAFVELAAGKTPMLSRSLLRERPAVQLQVAEAETLWRAGRAFVFETMDELWRTCEAGQPVDLRQRAIVRLACSNAVAASVRAVEIVHAAAGSTANFTASPLERAFRDVHVVPQHVTVSPQWYEPAGRVLLGLDPGTPAL